MANWETTMVPLDAAHAVLSMFGIGPDHRAYQRWRRDDGFRLVDLEDALGESEFVLTVDWRAWLQDVMDTILDQLRAIGIFGTTNLGEEGDHGYVEIDGRRETVQYMPNDDSDFDRVIRSINALLRPKARYRRFRSCEGSDGWAYGLLPNEGWKTLEANAADLTRLLFVEET